MRIGIGISGGVDSAVAAAILKEQGHEVLGFTMLLFPEAANDTVKKSRQVCNKLGIHHEIADFREQFSTLILDYFTNSYAKGFTPSPCCRCNKLVKFGLLLDAVKTAGCQFLATGHYALLNNIHGETALYRGKDASKDQSYFLAMVSKEQLAQVLFPLGEMQKNLIKIKGEELRLVPKEQAESQDLCFLPNGGFADFVAARMPELIKPGEFVDASGKVLGTHNGAFRYTVGQRRGLGVSANGPWFVLSTDMENNRVILGHAEALNCSKLGISQVNWLIQPPEDNVPFPCQVQTRYLMRPRKAHIIYSSKTNTARVIFLEPAPKVPAGQLAAMYNDNQLLAGGWITETE